MFRYFQAKKNKQQGRPKVTCQDYIYTPMEQSDNIFNDLPLEQEVELQGNIYEMRREFKRVSKKIRGLYIR
ncbi:hypothetical protein H7X68_00695 [Candidatus Saccharibacteria bacterium]|nr:hypothetical protein [Candidatus Saccharibacteria bacterium]